MQEITGKAFFDNIRRSIKISYFIASIIPLGLLAYLFVQYIYPLISAKEAGLPLDIGILLVFAVVASVLGLALSVKTTNSSISSVQNLHVKLNSIVDIIKQLRETPYLDILLENIVKSAIRLNSAEAGSLLLFEDDDHENLRFRVALGKGSKKLMHKTVKKGTGISGTVAETGKPMFINDIRNSSFYNPSSDRETGFNTRSIMCVPLMFRKEILGVIEVLNRKEGLFAAEDEKLLSSLADQAAISIAHSKLRESEQSDIIQLTTILVESQDYFSQVRKGHARNVANYANMVGRKMGLSDQDLKKLYYASLLHDIGFMRIPMSNPPKPEELKRVKEHSRIGYDLVRSISIWGDAAEVILQHHERFDGKGYPDALSGKDISLAARILSVADTFDALTNRSTYRDRLDFIGALGEIENHAGSQFDPGVVSSFRSALKEAEMLAS